MIGFTSLLNVVWWLVWGLLVYIKTNDADSTMLRNSGGTSMWYPISWLWDNLYDNVSVLQYTAIEYLWIFIFYAIISMPEFIFWLSYEDGNL